MHDQQIESKQVTYQRQHWDVYELAFERVKKCSQRLCYWREDGIIDGAQHEFLFRQQIPVDLDARDQAIRERESRSIGHYGEAKLTLRMFSGLRHWNKIVKSTSVG